MGFDRAADGTLVLRTVAFDMQRLDTDGETRVHRINIPVLTLVTIPLLTIEEASLEFELQVEDLTSIKTEDSGDSSRPVAASFLPISRSKIVTRLARTTRQDTTTKSDLKMTVKIAQSPFPLGIERLLNTADLSVEDAPQ